jgi:hypothetical protein
MTTGCHDQYNLNTWAGIVSEHNVATNGDGACATCHNSSSTTVSSPYTDVADVIANVTAASCDTCHEDKTPNGDHGGHPGDWGTTSTCSNASCHTVASASEIMTVIHGNGTTTTCTICHTGGTGDGTARVGDATNGVDGDATIMDTLAGGGAAGYNNTICTDCHDITDPDVNAGSIGGIHHNNASSGVVALTPSTNCTTNCHAGTAEKTQDHSTAITDSGNTCDGCHNNTVGTTTSANIDSGQAKQHDECDTCHAFDAGWAGILDTPSTNRGVDTMTAGDCTGCHDAPDNWTSMHTPVAVTIHGAAYNNYVTTDAACISCHDSGGTSDARSTSATPYIANGTPTDVHYNGGNGCATCHNADGTMRSTGITLAISPVPSAGASNTCQDCHINGGSLTWTSLHTGSSVVDHAAEVAVLASCGNATVPCHDTTGGIGAPNIATLVSSGDDKLHDTCTSCHNAVGGTINGSASPTGGGTMNTSGGTCDQCHSMVFADHSHHTVANQVSYNSTRDISQTGTTPDHECGTCHIPTGGLSTWTGVYNEHNANCGTCHGFVQGAETTGDPGTPVEADVLNRIATNGTTNCIDCHVKKSYADSPSTSEHGGHSSDDWAWQTADKNSCGVAACHDWSNNQNVVADIHNNTCTNCHDNANGGDGTAIGYGTTPSTDVGDATLANTTNHQIGEGCTVCHTLTLSETHHGKTGGNAANGDCHLCHIDPRTDGVGAENIAYKQLACRECHVKAFGGGIEITDNVIKGGPLTGATGDQTGNLQNTIAAANHQFPNTTSINNYGACFYCHGQTGVGAGRATTTVVPWHALPKQTLGRANLGADNVLDTNEMGGGGWQIDNTSAPNVFPASEFQGANPSFDGGTMWNTAYYPMGKERLNIGWAMLSHTKKAANAGTTKENNAGIITHSGFNIPAGMLFGTATPPHVGSIVNFPHFDASPPALDTITGASATDSWSCGSGATGPCGGARSITVSATSSTGATLYVIYGGKVVHSQASPMNNVTIDMQAFAAGFSADAGDNDIFASGGPGVIFVVSSDGGSAKIISSSTSGQGAN